MLNSTFTEEINGILNKKKQLKDKPNNIPLLNLKISTTSIKLNFKVKYLEKNCLEIFLQK